VANGHSDTTTVNADQAVIANSLVSSKAADGKRMMTIDEVPLDGSSVLASSLIFDMSLTAMSLVLLKWRPSSNALGTSFAHLTLC
jgi:hypothetical protein